VLVKLHDVEGMAESLHQGLTMSLSERKERWTAMMATIERNAMTHWRERLIAAPAAGGDR
jgi:trehalose 6-phosphate synthase